MKIFVLLTQLGILLTFPALGQTGRAIPVVVKNPQDLHYNKNRRSDNLRHITRHRFSI